MNHRNPNRVEAAAVTAAVAAVGVVAVDQVAAHGVEVEAEVVVQARNFRIKNTQNHYNFDKIID